MGSGHTLNHTWERILQRWNGRRGDEILLLGIGIQAPWQLVEQYLDISAQPLGLKCGGGEVIFKYLAPRHPEWNPISY